MSNKIKVYRNLVYDGLTDEQYIRFTTKTIHGKEKCCDLDNPIEVDVSWLKINNNQIVRYTYDVLSRLFPMKDESLDYDKLSEEEIINKKDFFASYDSMFVDITTIPKTRVIVKF